MDVVLNLIFFVCADPLPVDFGVVGFGIQVTGIFVEQQMNDRSGFEITFRARWLGSPGSPAYRAYLERTIGEIRDRTIERCGGN